MEVIEVNGKYYDPYFILNITQDDTDQTIKKSFKTLVKLYHPDKANTDKERYNYEKKFKILVSSYEYIKNKREQTINITKRKEHTKNKEEYKNFDNQKEISEFNNEFTNLTLNPNDYGYGNRNRYLSVDDYKSFNERIYNQFNDKKFSKKEFNKMFEWNKTNYEEEEGKALIHKTTDGFYGYNTADISNCSLVNTYNGLLITGDDLGESGIGYWSDNYGDCKKSFGIVKNPDKSIKVPKNFKTSDKIKIDKRDENRSDIPTESSKTYIKEEEILIKNTYEQLKEKEKKDKKMVMKYINQYDEDTVKQCINGILEKAPTYISVLKYKEIKN